MIKIIHASIDEHNTIKNGQAGDQTGREVCTRDYYEKNWKFIIIPPENVRTKAIKTAEKLANSNLVGYDQNQRNTLYTQLKKNKFSVKKYIDSNVATETDCSAFVYACLSVHDKNIRMDGNAPTTSTMASFYEKNGYTVIPYDKNKLINGCILVAPGHHTVMVMTDNKNEKIPEKNNIKNIPNPVEFNTIMHVRISPSINAKVRTCTAKDTKYDILDVIEAEDRIWVKIKSGYVVARHGGIDYVK